MPERLLCSAFAIFSSDLLMSPVTYKPRKKVLFVFFINRHRVSYLYVGIQQVLVVKIVGNF